MNYSFSSILAYRFLIAILVVQLPSLALTTGEQSQKGSPHLESVSDGVFRVFVQGPDGAAVDELALVILTNMEGQVQRANTLGGYAVFNHIPDGLYDVEIIAAGYAHSKERMELNSTSGLTVTLQPDTIGHQTLLTGPPVLAPKAKRELNKALEAMRAGKLPSALGHLDRVYRLAPANPDVNYFLGIYFIETNEFAKAKNYLGKTLNLDPKPAHALLSLGMVLLKENNSTEALPYLKRAIEVEPAWWRAHALLAEAYLHAGSLDESILHAERALEFGYGQAATVQPLLASAVAKRGYADRAIKILQTYLKDHSSDTTARKQLENLQLGSQQKADSEALPSSMQSPSTNPSGLEAVASFVPSTWLPPDIDEAIPPVESGQPCALDEVVRKAGDRVREFVTNVDRFTATETITHETINRWGLASSPVKFKFDYLVSIEEIKPGFLDVEEFRSRTYSADGFPDGIVDRGLAAQLLIFHPYHRDEFDMTCEGLAHWHDRPVWQVHFRQRNDRPSTTKSYRIGENGPSYPAALKGRAWIAADSFQIVRLEMNLAAPLPEIRLVADHTVVEYGPVDFRERTTELWLPQTADFYYDWRGHRGRRVHRFTNYLLFSVDEKQSISAPRIEDKSPAPQ